MSLFSRFARGQIKTVVQIAALVASVIPFHAHAKQDSDCVKTCSDIVVFSGPDSGALSKANLFNHNSSDAGNEKGSTRQTEIKARGFNNDGSPGGDWGQNNEDQWCADHGYVTDETVRPKIGPLVPNAATQAGYTPPAATGAAACAYSAIEPGDEDCNALTKRIKRCSLQKGQLVKMCAAYATAADGIAWQYVLAALDAATAAICGYECLSEASGSGWSNACTVAACASGIMETVATVAVAGNNGAKQQESTASGWEYLLGGVGALSGLGKCAVGIGGMVSGADKVLDARQAEQEKKAGPQ